MSKLGSISGVAGLIGTISSVVGVSISNNRSTETADKTPTHKWNIEIPEPISAEVKCSGNNYKWGKMEAGTGEVSLEWIAGMSDNKNDLIKGRGVTVDTEVSLKWKGQNWKWWNPIENLGPGTLWVSTGSRNDTFSLIIQYTVMQNSKDKGTRESVALTCRDSDIKVTGSRSSRLYSANTRRRGSGLYDVVDDGTKMKVTLSLRVCEVKEKGVECSLNVVTGSDLNWSTKVKQKANVTFSL